VLRPGPAGRGVLSLASAAAAWQIPRAMRPKGEASMAKSADQTPTPSRDLDALAEQTQTAALRLLDLAALTALQRDLRAMKESEQDEPGRKTLAQAMRRAAAEKRRRKEQGESPEPAAAAPAAPPPAPAPAEAAKPARPVLPKPDK